MHPSMSQQLISVHALRAALLATCSGPIVDAHKCSSSHAHVLQCFRNTYTHTHTHTHRHTHRGMPARTHLNDSPGRACLIDPMKDGPHNQTSLCSSQSHQKAKGSKGSLIYSVAPHGQGDVRHSYKASTCTDMASRFPHEVDSAVPGHQQRLCSLGNTKKQSQKNRPKRYKISKVCSAMHRCNT